MVLEEELGNTVRFIRDLAVGITVIFPHLGMLNGGFSAIAAAGLWNQENVWADPALAGREEIQGYLRSYGHQRLMFGSDFPFGDPYAELEKIRRLKKAHLDIRWRAILYPGRVTASLVRSMARAGCQDISLGFESGSPSILRRMNKRFSVDDISTVNRLLADAGIHRMGFLLLGGPGETRQTVQESLAFADRLKLDALKVTIGLRIYPYTQLARIALREGVVQTGDDLLRPAFYIARGLEEWLRETVNEWAAHRPHWMM